MAYRNDRTCQAECRQCNLAKHPFSKFRLGDRVCINCRTPAYVELVRHTPRRIVSIRYDAVKQCNFYTLGSNGRGETRDGQPLEGIRYYEFRSYQLARYQPRKYGKRRYRMHPGDPRLMSKSDTDNAPENTQHINNRITAQNFITKD